jgi:hypothetical protein
MVSRTPFVRFCIFTALDLIGKILEALYRSEGNLPWRHIFLLHRTTYPFTAHLFMASCKPFYARLRVLAATLPGSSWPFTLDLLDSAFVVYIAFSRTSHLFYIGKFNEFISRLRRHCYGFLRPAVVTVLRSLFGGDASAALASLTFVPIAHCYSEEDALKVEKLFIDTEHPPLNEPYVQKLLPVALSHLSLRPHASKRLATTARAARMPARFSQGRTSHKLCVRGRRLRTTLSSLTCWRPPVALRNLLLELATLLARHCQASCAVNFSAYLLRIGPQFGAASNVVRMVSRGFWA